MACVELLGYCRIVVRSALSRMGEVEQRVLSHVEEYQGNHKKTSFILMPFTLPNQKTQAQRPYVVAPAILGIIIRNNTTHLHTLEIDKRDLLFFESRFHQPLEVRV